MFNVHIREELNSLGTKRNFTYYAVKLYSSFLNKVLSFVILSVVSTACISDAFLLLLIVLDFNNETKLFREQTLKAALIQQKLR